MTAQIAKDNAQQIQADHGSSVTVENHYHDQITNEARDFGIIDEIFKNILKDLKSTKDLNLDGKYIKVEEKIKLNFINENDREVVRDYLKYALTRVSLIERRIQEEDNEIQNDLHSHILGRYRELKQQDIKNIEILEKLFAQFVIPNKENSPAYTNLAKAFVLFFFDDCTIFEKTPTEKQMMINF